MQSDQPPQNTLECERAPKKSRSDEGRKVKGKLDVQVKFVSSESDLPGKIEEFDDELGAVDQRYLKDEPQLEARVGSQKTD